MPTSERVDKHKVVNAFTTKELSPIDGGMYKLTSWPNKEEPFRIFRGS